MSIQSVGAAQLTPSSPQATKRDDEISKTAKDFEAVFLAQFVNEMLEDAMPKEGNGGFGEEMFLSVLGNALSEQIVDAGGIGLSKTIEQKLRAYKE